MKNLKKMTIENMLQNYEATWNDIVNNRNIDGINEANFTKDATIRKVTAFQQYVDTKQLADAAKIGSAETVH